MKINLISITIVVSMVLGLAEAAPPGTAFTYQGRLNDGSAPANGSYLFRFTVLDQAIGGNSVGTPIVTAPVDVSNGLFTVSLDFGPGIFTNAARWLGTAVHTNDNTSPFVSLTPPQQILPTPYAIFAETGDAAGLLGSLPAGSLSGYYSNFVGLTNVNNTFAGNGAGLYNVNAAQLSGLAASSFWQTAGNAGTTAGPNFLGTTDSQPLELRANSQRVLRLDAGGSAPNIVGGYSANSIGSGLSGVTIAGGGQASGLNVVHSSWGTVSGGSANFILDGSDNGVIAGGGNNLIGNSAGVSVISGGFGNFVSSLNAVVAGGANNWVQTGAGNSAISGGSGNVAAATHGSIGGGENNWVAPLADHSTIAGGYSNTNAGHYAAIGGGAFNSAGGYDVVSGGQSNRVTADWGGVGSGLNNLVSGAYSLISGGRDNVNSADASVIGGGHTNTIQSGATDATIAGGTNNTIQSGAARGTIAGGAKNTLRDGAKYSSIGGDLDNGIWAADHAVIGGGSSNFINTNSDDSTISGGFDNSISTEAWASTVGGGNGNFVRLASPNSTIGGGYLNRVSSNSPYCSIGGGANNLVHTNVAVATIPGGRDAAARSFGQLVYSSGSFAPNSTVHGDAQSSLYVLRGTTTNATITELYLDGNGPTSQANRMIVPSGGAWAFDILIIGIRIDALQTAGYQIKGMVLHDVLFGSTVLIGTPSATILDGSAPSWSAQVLANNGALIVQVTGAASTTVRWVASVRTAEVGILQPDS